MLGDLPITCLVGLGFALGFSVCLRLVVVLLDYWIRLEIGFGFGFAYDDVLVLFSIFVVNFLLLL